MAALVQTQKREPVFLTNEQVCHRLYKRYGYRNISRMRSEDGGRLLQIEFDQLLMGLFDLGKINKQALVTYKLLKLERSDRNNENHRRF